MLSVCFLSCVFVVLPSFCFLACLFGCLALSVGLCWFSFLFARALLDVVLKSLGSFGWARWAQRAGALSFSGTGKIPGCASTGKEI